MPVIPSESSLDSTLALFADPYRFISRRARAHGSDLFSARIFFRRTICMTGSEAAALICDNQRFERKGATPVPIQKTLTGKGGVLNLDGQAHDHRKQMFLTILSPERVNELVDVVSKQLDSAFMRWEIENEIVLYHELQKVLCRAVCDWAGVPLNDRQLPRRTRQLVALYDRAASKSLLHFWARFARRRTQAWTRRVIRKVRRGRLTPPENSAAKIIAEFRDLDRKQLKPRVAAVELLNILRPVIAVSVFLTDAAHAIHLHPECVEKLRSNDEEYLSAFVQEVRRYYPFFPMIAAKVKTDFEWRGYEFTTGSPVLLDVYGINHDSQLWDNPAEFRPERFLETDKSAYRFVPQGPGDYLKNHRCPGEPLTIELMKRFVRSYVHKLTVNVPPQDLEIDFSRMPSLPKSRMILKVRRNWSIK